jgi:hypothetical protein
MNKEYKALAVLASRLAESVLMDWDKEEQVRLAKEVATKCHSIFNDKESREFVSLARRMREAQKELDTCSIGDYAFVQHCAAQLESEVDEYLKKLEE